MIRTSVTLECDYCASLRGSPSQSAANARKDARAEGWHRVDSIDICPACWSEGKRNTGATRRKKES